MLAAQVVHAAGESSPGGLKPGTYAVVLACDDFAPLMEKLRQAAIEHRQIIEETGPYGGETTAVGVVPKRRSQLKKYFSSYPLLR